MLQKKIGKAQSLDVPHMRKRRLELWLTWACRAPKVGLGYKVSSSKGVFAFLS